MMIKSLLLHISKNMWEDNSRQLPPEMQQYFDRVYTPDLRFDEDVWRKSVDAFVAAGGNMLIVDLGDAIRYKSHPEIAVENAWSVDKLCGEIKRLETLGLEVIPKLNFSAAHDAWLKDYSRMVGTPKYYEVCSDLISEVVDIFKGPRFFHIGMDEETASHQKFMECAVVRQGQKWFDDVNFFCDKVRSLGVRPWMWGDEIWRKSNDEWSRNIPKDVLQSIWYYWDDPLYPEKIEEPYRSRSQSFLRMEAMGYEQIPTGSNWENSHNYADLLRFSARKLDQRLLKGFMMAPWYFTLKHMEGKLLEAVGQFKEAHELYDKELHLS